MGFLTGCVVARIDVRDADRVPRPPLVPRELTRGPFTTVEARRAGLQRWHLEGTSWRRLRHGAYIWAGLSETPVMRLEAARLRRPASMAFSGKTAAWLHGLDVPCDPIETIRPEVDDCDVVVRRGFRATSLPRTIFDLSNRLSLTEAVVVADQALHAKLLSHTDLRDWIDSRAATKGVRKARRVLEFAQTGAESPMETRLRMLLVLNGQPRPELQFKVQDETGTVLGRLDMYYREQRLGLEYDGDTHRASLVEDNRRQNRLLMAGVRLLRFTASDVLRRPEGVLSQVRDMLAGR